jgi:hypothetical protein
MATHIGRFVLRKKWIRDGKEVKHHAFIPPNEGRLSVNEHNVSDADELWPVGEDVAQQRGLQLFGRADVSMTIVQRTRLTVEAAPLAGNPTHVEITGWPSDKEDRISKAQELAADAKYHPKPS